jgi:uncharacterized membrane protein
MRDTMRGADRTNDYGFWGGFIAGAVAGATAAAGTMMLANTFSSRHDRRVLRLEDSVQIGRPVAEVFRAWAELERLPDHIRALRHVQKFGDRSEWIAAINGKEFRWDAEATQVIPNEAIGWKSVNGPKHSGRISFAPLGNDTLVHVTMNYVPPFGLGALFSGFQENLDAHISHALREFKAALERGARTGAVAPDQPPAKAHWREERRTGTDDVPAGPGGPVEVTRPPSAGYPTPIRDTNEK